MKRLHLRHDFDANALGNGVAQDLRRDEPDFVVDAAKLDPIELHRRDALSEAVHTRVGTESGDGPEGGRPGFRIFFQVRGKFGEQKFTPEGKVYPLIPPVKKL